MIAVTRAFALALALCLCAAAGAAADRPPNIAGILTDDQGYAGISFNPDHPKEVATPHMGGLAKEGEEAVEG